ncbi:flotillin family protein [Gilvimarinus algae]|uniref:Flotillin domain-containing protein n=1 Tax=Gilvimarinus algae TaxID=3058037 RepID=A0ABT8TI03_9GAMM|nr:flotillin domain-containing protein [Gilvimarinus sp. SDUM040014]MDO3383655.1 flotillin domain-containing protein [Gilvimarinus sp. SDUM040014]
MEQASNLTFILIVAGVSFVGLMIIGMIFARLYTRANKERAFVRTGFGGEKIIKDGGAIVLPVLHEIIYVNMNTLRLEVRRSNDQALITKDRLRVDVTAEFYVRVKPNNESIATAAQTLGGRTQRPEELKALVEGKFVDVLRSVAAGMTMEELHESRVSFVQEVQTSCAEDLFKNGLELESVSLTGLDQTAKEYFNAENAFDAEGLTKLTEQLESRRKIRNDIEQETMVQIQSKSTEAAKRQLAIQQDEEFARLDQAQEIENRRASQQSDIARVAAERRREAEEADIASSRSVELARIAMQEETQNRDIEKRKRLELASQDEKIAIAEKSKEESRAAAEADDARAQAVAKEENVTTVRETARAEREKHIVVIKAKEAAEREAIGITVEAEARKSAANDEAEAVRVTADAEAGAIRVKAEAEADGARQLNEAKNLLSLDQISFAERMEMIAQLPKIMEQAMKPAEKIDSIKIFDINGAPGFSDGGSNASAGGGNLSDQLVNAMLKHRANVPLLDSILKEIGLENMDPRAIIDGKLFDQKAAGETEQSADDSATLTNADKKDQSQQQKTQADDEDLETV